MKFHKLCLTLAIATWILTVFIKLTTPIFFGITGRPSRWGDTSEIWFGVDIFIPCCVVSLFFILLYYCTKPKNE